MQGVGAAVFDVCRTAPPLIPRNVSPSIRESTAPPNSLCLALYRQILCSAPLLSFLSVFGSLTTTHNCALSCACQAQSPSFLRTSVSSRAAQLQQQGNGAAGPLVRSSTALRASMMARADPFEAQEPEPQPFVEQLKAESQEAAAAAAGPGLMAALRRSISGSGKASSGRWGGRTPRQSMDAVAVQQPPAAHQAARHQQQQQQPSEVGTGELAFLDLDATRAYALGVHQVMAGLERTMMVSAAQTASEASSKPTTPRSRGGEPRPGQSSPAQPAAQQAQQPAAQQHKEEEESPQRQPAAQQQQQQEAGSISPAPLQAQESAQQLPDGGRPSLCGESSDAGGAMPPLQSGLASPAAAAAACRRQTALGRSSSGGGGVVRQLPLMGQACLDMLDKPPAAASTAGSSRQQAPLSTSTSMSLADVYKQTSGNLAPLSSGLSGFVRKPRYTQSSAGQGEIWVCTHLRPQGKYAHNTHREESCTGVEQAPSAASYTCRLHAHHLLSHPTLQLPACLSTCLPGNCGCLHLLVLHLPLQHQAGPGGRPTPSKRCSPDQQSHKGAGWQQANLGRDGPSRPAGAW